MIVFGSYVRLVFPMLMMTRLLLASIDHLSERDDEIREVRMRKINMKVEDVNIADMINSSNENEEQRQPYQHDDYHNHINIKVFSQNYVMTGKGLLKILILKMKMIWLMKTWPKRMIFQFTIQIFLGT